MKTKEFIDFLKAECIKYTQKNGKIIVKNGGNLYLESLTYIPEGVTLSAGGDLYLRSLTSIPEGVTLSAGGSLKLKSKTIKLNHSYLQRFNIRIKRGFVILYKKVSKEFKTQEGTRNETHWRINRVMEHPKWNPTKEECGEGKFHACAYPFWCDKFRNVKGDRYIAIKVNVKDIYEWKDNPSYPQKIGFRKGRVMTEVERTGTYEL
jgi:hypothetical protein